MSELHLDSLEITNFRCFEHLVIEKLGRVNLIVGKNSVGKTALLEALWLLSCDADWTIIHKILYDRNELVRYKLADSREESSADYLEKQEQIEAVKSFFFGRPPKNYELTNLSKTKLHSVNLDCSFSHEANVFKLTSNRQTIGLALPIPYNTYLYLLHCNIIIDTSFIPIQSNSGQFKSKNSVFSRIELPPLPKKDVFDYFVIGKSKEYKTVFVPLSGLTWKANCTYWDDLALTTREDDIISCLNLIEPSIKRFTFKGENINNKVRYPVVKSDHFDNPLPLANMGEGIQRVFAMALAMSTASNGYLLIDEFETGLHHSVQADVWRAVFKLAREWNVQVFATTHSWDCVEAFQEAAAEDHNEEAMLIRLQQKRSGEGIEAVLYDEALLAKATRQQVEVR